MSNKTVLQRKRLAALFASFSVLIMGTASLYESMSIDYYSVINTLEKIIPASLTLGIMGWFMGIILDQPKRRSKLGSGYSNLFLNKSVKDDVATNIYGKDNLTINEEPAI